MKSQNFFNIQIRAAMRSSENHLQDFLVLALERGEPVENDQLDVVVALGRQQLAVGCQAGKA
jgi:hypothetical protein